MRFLRRSEPAGDEPVDPRPAAAEPAANGHGGASGKGRPTPKRREAEARRRGPVAPPPRNQREALRRARGTKEDRRAERASRRERMRAGNDLLPRDRGPVRAYVRDIVDSRRQLMGLFMPLAGIVLLSIFVPIPALQSAVSLLTMGMLAVIVVEAIFLGRLVNQRVHRKFPGAKDSGVGLGFYAFTRATMMRRLRTPRPRVGYGELPD